MLERMSVAIGHRGPDDHGLHVDADHGVGLAHRRLAILDPSPAGHQPMAFDDLWAVHNGEMYNFAEVRKKLEGRGHRFETRTDTEVLLKGFREWGLSVVDAFRGMFATALWDRRNRQLHLIRDRVGVKPLYYSIDGERLLFASELRALLRFPGIRREVDADALALYLKLGYVPAPHSIIAGISKLEPGTILTVDEKLATRSHQFWDPFQHFHNPESARAGDDERMADELEAVLADSFKLRMVSDVPVGVFLSGGIDSSLVTALLQRHSDEPLKTFTIGFDVEGYNEAHAAKEVARHLGTDHHELYLTIADARNLIERLPLIYDEPFGDPSGIPTYLVSRFAREHVKVALSADGGDELFAGYAHHAQLERAYGLVSRSGGAGAAAVEMGSWFPFRQMLELKLGDIDLRLKKLREYFSNDATMARFYFAGRSYWTDDEIARLTGVAPSGIDAFLAPFEAFADRADNFVNLMRAADFRSYLPDDLLVKTDRASMAVGLEARDPFLDHEILAHVSKLPLDRVFRSGESKYILKRILHRHVPRNLVDRPKQGFSVPLDEWLRGDLKELLHGYLNEERVRSRGLFNWPEIDREIDRYLSGRIKSCSRLWFLIELEMWYETWMGGDESTA